VLIALDASPQAPFAMTPAAAWGLATADAPAIPRLIVVGVDTDDPKRYHDMTPPFPGALARAGGAPAFLRFLSTELRPYLSARYRTNSVTVLVGHSMSGLFAAWAFGQAPDFLTGAVALSPSLPISNRGPYRVVLDSIKGRQTPGRLFLAVGSEFPEMVGTAESLAAELNAQQVAGREVQFQRIPDASHSNTKYMGLIPGLLFMFRPVSLAGNPLAQWGTDPGTPKLLETFTSIRERYLSGARQLGLPERLPLPFLRYWTQAQAPALAPFVLRVCEEIIASYSTVWTGYDCVADAQGRLGRSDEANGNYKRALEAARKMGDTAAAERIAAKMK